MVLSAVRAANECKTTIISIFRWATMLYNHTLAFMFHRQQAFKFTAATKKIKNDKEGSYKSNQNQFNSIRALQRGNASHYSDALCICSLARQRVK